MLHTTLYTVVHSDNDNIILAIELIASAQPPFIYSSQSHWCTTECLKINPILRWTDNVFVVCDGAQLVCIRLALIDDFDRIELILFERECGTHSFICKVGCIMHFDVDWIVQCGYMGTSSMR